MTFSRAFRLMFVIGFVAIQAQVARPADVAPRHLRAQNKEFVGALLGNLFGGNNNGGQMDMGGTPGGVGGNLIQSALGMFLPLIQGLGGNPTQLLNMGMGIISAIINTIMGLLGGGGAQ